ncbi:Phosphoribosyl 1,2-cyclic phosphodiesterase [Phycisphaerae bacterium RAS1]|nr:Phosphoribosyl 1,2-cyclic phosphodiesterase [Phycisphaerae bacterium RAS1]
MTAVLRLTILGSGTSHGIPMIGCDCGVCTSPDSRDRRTRTSALFSFDDRHILIDTSPELRLQCRACDVRTVHAVLFTHHHADHVVGLDDVRRFNWINRAPLDIHADARTLARLEQMFGYAFHDDPEYLSAKPQLVPHEITGPFELFGRTITPIPYMHGPLPVLGFRVGDMAYCPDCNFIPDESRGLLRGLRVLVLDALRRRPHPTHFNLEQAVEEARRIGADRTYFIHIAHELGHAETNAMLPAGMELAYDGLVCS